ncbi:polyketide cyclase/dehydrase/lipid transport protein [Motilibacter peucedani]|uniref:Polyketide cyclase/dehydrase/lipid transport protein n=1 Tax=Motilibacter peucedani TaxID=598650 RepID=A0A420XJW5_9ACTN|nr:SRPBCC family protein [Motilibacter peucedani]RKS68051.1 polyketide cyclase/dehydrase/lipid transport protein [Motilibacter peucedani]
MEFEHSRVLPASAEQVFAVASDITRMARWLPTTDLVEQDSPNHLHVEGERSSRHYEGDGVFDVSPDQLRVEWGSDRTGDYAGWLQVHHQADEASAEVVLHLSFLDELDEDYRRKGRGEAVEQEMTDALERLEAEVRGSA